MTTNSEILSTNELQHILTKKFPTEDLNKLCRSRLLQIYKDSAIPKEKRRARLSPNDTAVDLTMEVIPPLSENGKRRANLMITGPGENEPNRKTPRLTNGCDNVQRQCEHVISDKPFNPPKRPYTVTHDPNNVEISQPETKRKKVTWP